MKKCISTYFISITKYLLLIFSCSISSINATDQFPDKTQRLTNMCKACHGEEGVSNFTTIPDLRWQNKEYLTNQLTAFKSHDRFDITMSKVAALLSEEDIQAIANYFYRDDSSNPDIS
ncbi:hypothetical protein [Candidatus Sororendozoicomonas aggregata]|uniref:c-type cytochrome n=1 Tax=Candidatus Sororendozoicomonas aggregata TaxID=3073239 RepID=UPI002ED698EF